MSYRLFTAIRPPAATRQALLAIMGGVERARWQSDEQLHLTLRFIGEVDGRTAEEVAAALSRIRHPAFDLTFEGVGLFDRRGRLESLWAGVKPSPALAALHKKIDRALIGLGLAPEGRDYKPHVTLARFGRAGGNADAFLAANGGLTLPAFAVREFALFESHLGRDGARYRECATYPLAKPL